MKEMVKKVLKDFKQQREYWIKNNEENIKLAESKLLSLKGEICKYKQEINEADVLLELGDTLFKEKGEGK